MLGCTPPRRPNRRPCCRRTAEQRDEITSPHGAPSSGLGPDIITPLRKNVAVHHCKNCALMSQMVITRIPLLGCNVWFFWLRTFRHWLSNCTRPKPMLVVKAHAAELYDGSRQLSSERPKPASVISAPALSSRWACQRGAHARARRPPARRDPSREVGREIMATEIVIAADRSNSPWGISGSNLDTAWPL